MISLTRLSGSQFVLNSDLIERIDSTPDTVITLIDGSKYVVSEDMRRVVAAIRLHRAEVIALSGYVQVTSVLDELNANLDPLSGIPDSLGRERPVRLAVVAPPADDATELFADEQSVRRAPRTEGPA